MKYLYCGYITTLKNIRKHSNADRLQCVEVFGQNVIVDLSYYDGQRVVFFPSDGQLSEEFANDNNLVRKKDKNGNNIGGYLDPDKRNIAALKLRGEKSEGLVLPVEVLAKYTNVSKLKDGEQITVLDGHEICKKYIPVRNHRVKANTNGDNKHKKKYEKETVSYPYFDEHIDTSQLDYNLHAFKEGDIVYLTRKLHGSSGRTSHSIAVKKKKRNLFLKKVFKLHDKEYKQFKLVSGTRRTILKNYEGGYYGNDAFRKKWHDFFDGKLPKGMTVYYEIVGWVDENRPIMNRCSNKLVKDEAFSKKYGDETVFTYGCKPGECDMYVYRMTMTNEDGVVIELPTEEVQIWCEKFGCKFVPVLDKFLFTTVEDLNERVNKWLDLPDEIDPTHISEGVVARIDNRSKFTAFKRKGFLFKVLEHIIKDNSDAPDIEEAEELIKN